MDPGLIFGAIFLGAIAVVVALTGLGSIWQRRRRTTQPARHEGERQSQRGRVFNYGTDHSNTPESW